MPTGFWATITGSSLSSQPTFTKTISMSFGMLPFITPVVIAFTMTTEIPSTDKVKQTSLEPVIGGVCGTIVTAALVIAIILIGTIICKKRSNRKYFILLH